MTGLYKFEPSFRISCGRPSLPGAHRSLRFVANLVIFNTSLSAQFIYQDSKLLVEVPPSQNGGTSSFQLLLCSGTFVTKAEIKCTVHVDLPKWPINQFKLDQQVEKRVLELSVLINILCLGDDLMHFVPQFCSRQFFSMGIF